MRLTPHHRAVLTALNTEPGNGLVSPKELARLVNDAGGVTAPNRNSSTVTAEGVAMTASSLVKRKLVERVRTRTAMGRLLVHYRITADGRATIAPATS